MRLTHNTKAADIIVIMIPIIEDHDAYDDHDGDIPESKIILQQKGRRRGNLFRKKREQEDIRNGLTSDDGFPFVTWVSSSF